MASCGFEFSDINIYSSNMLCSRCNIVYDGSVKAMALVDRIILCEDCIMTVESERMMAEYKIEYPEYFR